MQIIDNPFDPLEWWERDHLCDFLEREFYGDGLSEDDYSEDSGPDAF